MEKAPKDVSTYIASAPRAAQGKLRELRKAIREAAPAAAERISYGIPYYEYNGRLVYFAFAKKHIGLYAITAPVLKAHAREVRDYVASKGTLRFPLDEKLPLALIKKLVRAQLRRNEAKRRPAHVRA